MENKVLILVIKDNDAYCFEGDIEKRTEKQLAVKEWSLKFKEREAVEVDIASFGIPMKLNVSREYDLIGGNLPMFEGAKMFGRDFSVLFNTWKEAFNEKAGQAKREYELADKVSSLKKYEATTSKPHKRSGSRPVLRRKD